MWVRRRRDCEQGRSWERASILACEAELERVGSEFDVMSIALDSLRATRRLSHARMIAQVDIGSASVQ